MVNASLNWASIVGIVLAVCGGGLYFLRSFKPALARDYDVFFAAIGLLCGGILFFQGWRLDPILQFGQFLLAGTAIFWGYESVRLRGVATDQARRSSYFEEDEMPNMPRNSSRDRFNDDYDQFEDSVRRPSRRFRAQEDDIGDDYKDGRSRRRNISRAIPESAVSRRKPSLRESSELENEEPRRKRNLDEERLGKEDRRRSFGERRASRTDFKRGSRPLPNQEVSKESNTSSAKNSSSPSNRTSRSSIRSQTSTEKVEDASFTQNINEVKKPRQTRRTAASGRSNAKNQPGRYTVGTKKNQPRDNSSRFDD